MIFKIQLINVKKNINTKDIIKIYKKNFAKQFEKIIEMSTKKQNH